MTFFFKISGKFDCCLLQNISWCCWWNFMEIMICKFNNMVVLKDYPFLLAILKNIYCSALMVILFMIWMCDKKIKHTYGEPLLCWIYLLNLRINVHVLVISRHGDGSVSWNIAHGKQGFLYPIHHQVSNISRTKCQHLNILVLSCGCLCRIPWSQMLSREWRCSWSSTDRRCSNYIWVIDNCIILPTKVRLMLEILQ